MINIKIDFLGQSKNIILNQFLDSSDNTYKNCKLFINSDIENADYLFVIDGIDKEIKCNINSDKTYFLTAEVLYPKGFYGNKDSFLNQFKKIHSCHDIFKENVVFDLPYLPWMLYSGYHFDVFSGPHKYLEIADLKIEKTKNLSVFCSNKASNEHHSLRLRFVTELKKYFKDKMDWFGGGINPINPKAGGILPYKYHLALENFSGYNIITEKLYDSYLGLSYPIYYGAPNVNDYFPKNSFSQINIADLKGSIRIIEECIEGNLYEKNLTEIQKAKELVLNEYNIFKRIVNIALEDSKNNDYLQNKKNIIIYPEKKVNSIVNLSGRIIRKVGQKIIDLS